MLAGCSSDDSSESSATDGPAVTSPSETSTPASVVTDTTTSTVPLSAAAAAIVVPGSPGLIDETVWQTRVDDYLAFATTAEHSANPTGICAYLGQAHRDPDFVWPIENVTVESLQPVFDQIDNWEDTRDFRFMALHWMLALGQGDTPMTQLSPDVLAAIDERMLANRYAWDDPLPDDRLDNLWYWSENHIVITRAIEYLAGQRYPDETFAVTGLTGAEHLERAKPFILEWIDERAKLGFFEWHSNVYMLKNITPLHMLAELADDPEIVLAAAMALDMCLVDMAAHNQAGTYTAPRGRTYKKDKMSSLDEDTFNVAKFVFDDTTAPYQSTSDTGVTYFCSGTRYRPPQLVIDIATDPQPSVVRERHGVYFDGSSPLEDNPVAPYDKDFSDRANLPFWWSLGALGMWPLAEVSVAAGNEFRLWETSEFGDIALLAAINDYDPAKIRVWEQERAAVINFGFLSEANTYAYREPKVSLASVLDHRFGEMRDQGQAWQAAIDENAMVFTTHPVPDVAESTVWDDDSEPGYWTGEASMPRSAQHRGTAIHIYQPKWDESTDPLVWGVFEYRPFTHAYVPQDHFDEVRQIGQLDNLREERRLHRAVVVAHADVARVRPDGQRDSRDGQAVRPRRRGWAGQRVDRRGRQRRRRLARRLRDRGDGDRAVGGARRRRVHRVVDVAVVGDRRLLEHRRVPGRRRRVRAERPSPPRVAVGWRRSPVEPVQPDRRRLDVGLRLRHHDPGPRMNYFRGQTRDVIAVDYIAGLTPAVIGGTR